VTAEMLLLSSAGWIGCWHVPTTTAPLPAQPRSEAIRVLTLKEAATRLGISTSDMEAMVRRGAVKSVVAGWTTMVLASEVERHRS